MKTRERARVFCASMADVFEARDDLNPYRARLWDLIEATPALDWLLLTKRPEEGEETDALGRELALECLARHDDRKPWSGPSKRMPHLLARPGEGAVSFVRAVAG
jgi:hypothetical protein